MLQNFHFCAKFHWYVESYGIHTFAPVIPLSPSWVFPAWFFGRTSTSLLCWSALDCGFICGPNATPVLGPPSRVFNVPSRLVGLPFTVAGYATRGRWTRSRTGWVGPGFWCHWFLGFLLLSKIQWKGKEINRTTKNFTIFLFSLVSSFLLENLLHNFLLKLEKEIPFYYKISQFPYKSWKKMSFVINFLTTKQIFCTDSGNHFTSILKKMNSR